MTLIEIIINYAQIVAADGRERGYSFLVKTCDSELWEYITNTVNDDGKLIDIQGDEFFIGEAWQDDIL